MIEEKGVQQKTFFLALVCNNWLANPIEIQHRQHHHLHLFNLAYTMRAANRHSYSYQSEEHRRLTLVMPRGQGRIDSKISLAVRTKIDDLLHLEQTKKKKKLPMCTVDLQLFITTLIKMQSRAHNLFFFFSSFPLFSPCFRKASDTSHLQRVESSTLQYSNVQYFSTVQPEVKWKADNCDDDDFNLPGKIHILS